MLRALPILLPAIAAGLLTFRLIRPGGADGAGRTVFVIAGAGLGLTVLVTAGMVLVHGGMLVPDASPSDRAAAALSTWIGRVIAVQAGLSALALACLARPAGRPVAVVLACLTAAAGALRGHVIATEDLGPVAAASVVHVSLATLWVAGLAALVAARLLAVRRDDTARRHWAEAVRRFSPWALRGMLVLLSTGVVLADRTVATGAALLMTPYGQALLVKLLVIGASLACAGRLRRWLATSAPSDGGHPGGWLGLEAVLAMTVVVIAASMASTIPAAHDVIDWPFTFRVAPTAAWLRKGQDLIPALALALAAVFLAAIVAWRRRRQGAMQAGAIALVGLSAGAALALPALSVEAYPTTYLHSPVPYDAGSVAAGAQLYRRWCVQCHGAQGRGDGPLASDLPVRPANLTEPHVQWHTHGDLYWWLTMGIPRSGMPGFRDHLSDEARWQLLNYLTALSLGHEARPISGTVAPLDPWLPAIDIHYPSGAGAFSSLSEWRRQERPVLLGFVNDEAQRHRLEALAGVSRRAGVQAVLVLSGHAATITPPDGWEGVVDASGDIGAAWSLYRRTLEDPDFDDERPGTGGLLFLIDRFGFVRARWAGATALPDVPEVTALTALLAKEPPIRSADIHGTR